MNQTIQDLFNRKSTRVFTDEPSTEEERKIILESAFQAPTAGNMTLYSILDIQEQELKEELAKRCDNQPFIANAPLVLIFLADFQKWYDIFNACCEETPIIGEADLFLASEDCVIAAQNAVVAAQSMGIGSCYIGDIMENFEINKEMFHLPTYALPYSMVVFGRPTQQQIDRQKPGVRQLADIFHLDARVHKRPGFQNRIPALTFNFTLLLILHSLYQQLQT